MYKFENYCNKYGFTPDDAKTEFRRILNSNIFKTLHLETYTLDPYMLLLRTVEKNVSVAIENDRAIICKRDKYKTSIANIILDSVTNCIIKKYNDIQYEFVFSIHNICYKMLAII